eukprot:gb/GECH01010296.1/.p1 GENE.gb/GECH01010296.1/~~gb/GECH01010296.1/.p1  ORF type:complete len:463 (+),score=156.97 gb/GECH01010296.1/:1-1389(+)
MSQQAPDVIVRDLIFLVAGAFYQPVHSVVLATLLHEDEKIKDDELATRLKLPPYIVRRALIQLHKDQLLRSEDKQEARGTGFSRTSLWYYDYQQFIDAVRFRVEAMRRRLKQRSKELNKTGSAMHKCPSCGKLFNYIELATLLNAQGTAYECRKCKVALEEHNQSADVEHNEKLKQKFQTQLKPIMDQLKLTEDIVVPKYRKNKIGAIMTKEQAELKKKEEERREQYASSSSGSKTTSLGDSAPGTRAGHDGNFAPENVELNFEVELKHSDEEEDGHNLKQETPFFLQRDDNIEAEYADSSKYQEKNGEAESSKQETNEIQESSELGSEFNPEVYSSYIKQQLDENKQSNGESVEAEEAKPESMNENFDNDDGFEHIDISLDQDKETKKGMMMSLETEGGDLQGESNGEYETMETTEEEDSTVTVNGTVKRLSEVTEEDLEQMTADEYESYYYLVSDGQVDF